MKKSFVLFFYIFFGASAFATAPGESPYVNIPQWRAQKEFCERVEAYKKFSKEQCLVLISVRDFCEKKPRDAVCYRTAQMRKPDFLGDTNFVQEIAIIQDYMKTK